MSELILIHRPRNGSALAEVLQQMSQTSHQLSAVWATCLRELVFLSHNDFLQIQHLVTAHDEVYKGPDVFTFMIEVVCGLRSPMLGETEVQGQFKQFVAELPEVSPTFWGFYSGIFQSILSESKRVRTAHLKNLGSQSYGSLIRRRLDENDNVSILGAGLLTQEVLPWMKHLKQIDVMARNAQKAEKLKDGFPQIQVRHWPAPPQTNVVVIAAPITNENLVLQLSQSKVTKIIDLRGEFSLQEADLQKMGLSSAQYESLQALMSEMNHDLNRINDRVSLARQAIRRCGEAFGNKVVSRPGGWEDLCG